VKKLFYTALIVLLASCTEKEELIVPGNTPPQDNTIGNVYRENYINKTYISVLGRKPTDTEYISAKQKMSSNGFVKSERELFVSDVLAKNEYYRRIYDIAKAELLNNTDSTDIQTFIMVFDAFLLDTSYQALWPVITIERNKLIALKNAPSDFANGTINIVGLYKRCVNNYFYDQINMGTENFVVSMFQHFLFRYPTTAELESGKKMVDGFSAYLFYQEGTTKDDFINIFFSADAYYQGRAQDLYKRYLYRNPSPTEQQEATSKYKSTNNYKELQKIILTSDEFVGLK
jgi:hypothetical protein